MRRDNAQASASGLLPHHANLITASAISNEVARARGYRTVSTKAKLKGLGFGEAQRRIPALLIPIWSITGEIATYQIRPDEPRIKDGKPLKYETPAGARMALDVPPAARPLLGDPAIPLFITEGARKADAAVSQGLCCIALLGVWNFRGTNEHGGLTALADWEHVALKGRKAYICFDSDVMEKDAVRLAMKRLRSFLELRGADVRLIYLPAGAGGVKVGLDDYLAAGGTVDGLMRLASADLRDEPDIDVKPERKSQATILVELAGDAELFRTPEGEPYASVEIGGHTETWPLKSRGLRDWLMRRFYETEGKSPSTQGYQDAFGVLSGEARFGGKTREVYVRVAEHEGAIYVDLADEAWRVIRIDAEGWKTIASAEAPVRFRRANGMRPFPEPVRRGALSKLRHFINVTDEDWPLIAAWLVAALRPSYPFPLLAVHGEQGSAKSTTTEMLCALVDPRKPALRSEPRNVQDLMIAAKNSWLVAYDNLSSIPVWLSDALCRLTTGGGFGTRELYADDEEILFDAMRPIILNGITELATRADLLDRALVINLPTIPDEKRRTEAELWGEFEQARPAILGKQFDAVSVALRNLPTVKLERSPRMADFTKWVIAAEPALGLEPGTFLRTYRGNRAAANDLALEVSPVAAALISFIKNAGRWTGVASELLKELNARMDEDMRRQKRWPKSAQGMGGELKRLAPNLRAAGVNVTYGTGRARRKVTLEKNSIPLSQTSRLSPDAVLQGSGNGDNQNAGAHDLSPQLSRGNSSKNGSGDDGDERDKAMPTFSNIAASRADGEIHIPAGMSDDEYARLSQERWQTVGSIERK
jgi:hypothetical protein